MRETIRRDNKGRKLWNGESQRKDGKYEYKYQDVFGNRKTVYSWKLTASDTLPKGKRECIPLREQEKQIKRDQNDGRGYSSIHSVRGVVRPAFQMAVDDDLIRKNPFEFQLNTVIVNDSVTREAITEAQESAFLDFIKNDDHFSRYYDGMYILFHTGLRVSEFVVLTFRDVDFENGRIDVNHQLQRTRNMQYMIEDTKTSSGTRYVPMTPEVEECFRRIVSSRRKPKKEPMVDGKCGFLFLDKNEMPMVALHWEKYFHFACAKYNRLHRVQMPKITPHVCRHTFCSNMAKAGMNPKTLQYIMGHSEIGVTLNTYMHLGYEDASAEMLEINAVGKKYKTV